MKRAVLAALTAFGVGAAVTLGAQGQSATHAPILVPGSSAEQPGERGVAAHTNHMIRVGREAVGASPAGETPASIAGAYQLGSLAATGAGTIVIVDAFDYPTALHDFNVFSTQFGLPTEPSANATAATNGHFQVVYAGGPKAPRANCILDVSKLLSQGIRMRPVQVAMEDSLERWQVAGRPMHRRTAHSEPLPIVG